MSPVKFIISLVNLCECFLAAESELRKNASNPLRSESSSRRSDATSCIKALNSPALDTLPSSNNDGMFTSLGKTVCFFLVTSSDRSCKKDDLSSHTLAGELALKPGVKTSLADLKVKTIALDEILFI